MLLSTYIFQHVGHDANNIGQKLVKRAMEHEECVVMRNDIPVDLHSLVTAETAGEGDSPNLCNLILNH
jgi:hypothetical protein